METMFLILKITVSAVLILIAIYSAIYFGQITRVEKQFGLKLPLFVKKMLRILTMVPMAISLVVLLAVLIQV